MAFYTNPVEKQPGEQQVTESNGKLENYLEVITCAICKALLVKPVSFPCIHHFCKACIEKLPQVENEGQTGALCPECKQFTRSESIKPDFLMEQIVELHSRRHVVGDKCNVSKKLCDFCLSVSPKYKCIQCKMILCESCRKGHLRTPSCKGHSVKALEDLDAHEIDAIDSIVFCTRHSDKIIEFSCVQCNQAICYRCKILDHDHHSTQTIESAIEKLLPSICEKLQPIESNITELESKLHSLNNLEEETRKTLNEHVTNLIDNGDRIHQKLESDIKELNEELQQVYECKLSEIERMRSEYTVRLSSLKTVKCKIGMLLKHLKGTNLLLQLQGDLMSTLENQKASTSVPSLDIKPVAKHIAFEEYDEYNIVGFIYDSSDNQFCNTKDFIFGLQEKIFELECEQEASQKEWTELEESFNSQIEHLRLEKDTLSDQVHQLELDKSDLESKLEENDTKYKVENDALKSERERLKEKVARLLDEIADNKLCIAERNKTLKQCYEKFDLINEVKDTAEAMASYERKLRLYNQQGLPVSHLQPPTTEGLYDKILKDINELILDKKIKVEESGS